MRRRLLCEGYGGSVLEQAPLAALRRGQQLLPTGVPGARDLVRTVLTSMFGPPAVDPSQDRGDPGLTGPGSPSWRVIAEPAAIAGGIRALLLQLTHPLAMAGVADHSRFRTAPLERLQGTSAWVTVSTFGSWPETVRVARRVRALHTRVRGTAPDGQPYAADAPELLAWVQIALTSSFYTANQLWALRPLGRGDADAFVAEQSRLGALLDPRVDLGALDRHALRAGLAPLPLIDEGLLPTTVAELEARLADYAPEQRINHQGREALGFLRRPPLPPVAGLGYRALIGGVLASLDPSARRALELRMPGPVRAAAIVRTGAALAAMRVAVGTSPTERAAADRVQAA